MGETEKHRANRLRDQYAGPFSFHPDYTDPELGYRRNLINADYNYNDSQDLNDLSRSGLIGSSAAMGVTNRGRTQRAAALEGSDASVLSRQRGEQFDLYRSQKEWERELERMRIANEYQSSGIDRASILQGLGKIGSLASLFGGNPSGLMGLFGGDGGGGDFTRYNYFGSGRNV